MKARARLTVRSAIEGDEPPIAFCIFRAGANDSTKGPAVFDKAAAQSVMAAYEAHGPEVMIDLEHLALDPESRSYNPDAQGWCQLELRADGSLWAVDVRWTPEGEKRLREKRQRFISPCFEMDPKTKRVVSLINIALTALPATHQLTPLIAANAVARAASGGTNVNGEDLKKAIEAIKNGDGEGALAVLEAMVVDAAADGETPAEPEVEVAADPAVPPKKPEDEDEEEQKAAAVAASMRLSSITGKATLSEAVREVELWKASHLSLESREKKLAAERLALESGERRELVGQLVKLGVEIPATAWADPMKPGKPCKRLQDEPIVELRNRVKILSAARGDKALPATRPVANGVPEGGKAVVALGQIVQLSARELRICSEMGTKPEDYAATKLRTGRAQSA